MTTSCDLQPCKKWHVQYTPFICLIQQLRGDFRSNDVISWSLSAAWGHVTSFPVMWLRPVSYSLVGRNVYSICQFSALYSRFQVTFGQMTSLPGHLQSPEVMCRHFLSRDCLLLRDTALQVVKCTVYANFFGPLEPLPGHFRSNDVTFMSVPVTWGDVTPFPVTWLRLPASYSLVGSEMYSIYQFSALYSHFQVNFGQMKSLPGHFRSPGHVRSFPVT